MMELKRMLRIFLCFFGHHEWHYSRIDVKYKKQLTGEQRICLSCRKHERLAAYRITDWE